MVNNEAGLRAAAAAAVAVAATTCSVLHRAPPSVLRRADVRRLRMSIHLPVSERVASTIDMPANNGRVPITFGCHLSITTYAYRYY